MWISNNVIYPPCLNLSSISQMKNSFKQELPDVFVAIGYESIYNDYKEINIHSLLSDIPTVSLLDYIIEQNNRVIYSFGASNKQREMLHETCRYLSKDTRKKVRAFMCQHEYISYIDNYGSILFMGLALQDFTPLTGSELPICQDEYESVFKAVIYCNQRWIDEQEKGIKANTSIDIGDISMLVDLPIVEFKLHKDFKVQLYKACRFFDFCEQHPKYSNDLKTFCNKRSAKNWKDYLLKLFGFLECSLHSRYVTLLTDTLEDIPFFDQYIINIDECGNLWEGNNALSYFRDHFLLKVSPSTYLLINANFLIDKFYQGMRFDFFKALGGASSSYETYPNFSTCLSQDFSELYLFGGLIKKIYNERQNAIVLTGEDFKQRKITAEPDLYLRIGEYLFLFEYKDVTLGDDIKFSQDISRIKNGICDRICKYGKKRKGAGQLLYNIRRVFEGDLVKDLDPGVFNVSKVYPIIVTTDRSFSAMGVNRFVIQEFSTWIKSSPIISSTFITVPIIVELDTLVLCANMLHEGTLTLQGLLDGYIQSGMWGSLEVYAKDGCLKGKVWNESDIKFLFEDFFGKEAGEELLP